MNKSLTMLSQVWQKFNQNFNILPKYLRSSILVHSEIWFPIPEAGLHASNSYPTLPYSLYKKPIRPTFGTIQISKCPEDRLIALRSLWVLSLSLATFSSTFFRPILCVHCLVHDWHLCLGVISQKGTSHPQPPAPSLRTPDQIRAPTLQRAPTWKIKKLECILGSCHKPPSEDGLPTAVKPNHANERPVAS